MKGKAWGNALGGYRLQPRLPNGTFGSVGEKSFQTHRKLRKKKGGFVPYARKGLGHTTIGLNTGASVTKNRRVSAGFYIRTESMSGQKKAANIAKAQEHAQLAIAKQMPTGYGLGKANETGARTLGGNLSRVKRNQNRFVTKFLGKETKVGKRSYARLSTDRNSLPVVAVRWNSPKDKKKGSFQKRTKSIVSYNTNSATGKRTYDWTQKPVNSRPQRRKKAKANAVAGKRL